MSPAPESRHIGDIVPDGISSDISDSDECKVLTTLNYKVKVKISTPAQDDQTDDIIKSPFILVPHFVREKIPNVMNDNDNYYVQSQKVQLCHTDQHF